MATKTMPKTITRGTTVTFSHSFFDLNGAPTSPPGAVLYVNYQTAGKPVTAALTMAFDTPSQTWEAAWESSIAFPGTVEWSIKSTGVTPMSTTDGCFMLTANDANFPRLANQC